MRTSNLWLGLFQIVLIIPGVNCGCPHPRIKNGYVRRKTGNKIAFFCTKGFIRYGSRISECNGNKWNSPPPICVAPGCPKVPSNPRRDMDFIHNEAVVLFNCLDTFVLVGKATAYCDGEKWSSPAPDCHNPENIESCDFEDGEFCGWEQDEMDDFDWSRHSGETTTGRTGPDYDHTLGPTRLKGHYIYMESSAPRVQGHVARLLSPVYQQSKSGRCFRFWYHMKGPVGENLVGSLTISLRVYNGSISTEDDVLFTVKGNHGPDWREGQVFIYRTDRPFRIVLTATRQKSYIGDIAIDDISLIDCQGMISSTESSSTEVTSQTEEMETTELTTTGETTELSTAEVTQAPTGNDVTTTYPKLMSLLPVSNTQTKLMTSTSQTLTSSTASVINTGSAVIDVSTPTSSSFSGYINEQTESIHSKPTFDSSDLNQSLSISTEREDRTEEVMTTSFDNVSDTVYGNMYTPKPGVEQFVLRNKGVIHSISFVVSLTLGIAVIVVGALIIAFIVHRIKKQTKHYTDDDFETMHTATYRKQSTDGLIL